MTPGTSVWCIRVSTETREVPLQLGTTTKNSSAMGHPRRQAWVGGETTLEGMHRSSNAAGLLDGYPYKKEGAWAAANCNPSPFVLPVLAWLTSLARSCQRWWNPGPCLGPPS